MFEPVTVAMSITQTLGVYIVGVLAGAFVMWCWDRMEKDTPGAAKDAAEPKPPRPGRTPGPGPDNP